MLDEKANLEIEDEDGNTPIYFVVEQAEHYVIAKLMMQNGVNLKHKNKAGVEPLYLAGRSKADSADIYFMLAVSTFFFFLDCLSMAFAYNLHRAERCQDGEARSSERNNKSP